MDAELKRKWVAALRSGEYEQGQFALENAGRFCCLGVLCKVQGWPTVQMGDDSAGSRIDSALYNPIHDAVGDTGVVRGLAEKNDDDDLSFTEIADYIEANL